MSPKRHVLIIDPTLRGRAGHAYHASKALAAAVTAASLEPIVLTSSSFKDESDLSIFYQPAFSTNLAGKTELYNRTDWTYAGYEERAEVLRSEISDAIGRYRKSVCAVIMPTCEQALIKAVAELVKRRVLPESIGVLGWLLFPPRWDTSPEEAGTETQLTEFQDAVTLLRAFVEEQNAIKFCCETEALRERYDCVEGIEIALAALPALAKQQTGKNNYGRQQNGFIHFVAAGHVTPSKGFETLPGAIRAVLASNENARFTIHGVVEGKDNPRAGVMDEIDRLGPRVNVLRQDLSSEEYYALLRSADILLLPYRMPEYEHRGSGIFNESVELSIPVVAPARSDFARLAIEQERAVPIHRQCAEGVAEAVLDACRDFATLQDNCMAYQRRSVGAAATVVDEFLIDISRYTKTNKVREKSGLFQLPKFSVIITNHNYSDYIEDCLTSVTSQNYSNWECIIVDDNSTDDSRAQIEEFLSRTNDKRFRPVYLKKNVGQMGAMKAGFQFVTGRFVGFLDADDAWTPDYMKAHVFAHLNPDFSAGMSCCDMTVIDDEGHLVAGTWMAVAKIRGESSAGPGQLVRSVDRRYSDNRMPVFDQSRHSVTHVQQPFPARWLFSPTSGCVFRRDLLELMLPSSSEHFALSADYFFNMQASVLTGFLLVDAPLALYRIHNRNGYSKNPVVGGYWSPGKWSPTIAQGYDDRIVEHIRQNLEKYERVFGVVETDAAVRKIIGERSSNPVEVAQGSASRAPAPKGYKRHLARWKRSVKKRLLKNQDATG